MLSTLTTWIWRTARSVWARWRARLIRACGSCRSSPNASPTSVTSSPATAVRSAARSRTPTPPRARAGRPRRRAGPGARPMIPVEVTVNGRRYREQVEPRLLLSDFLRHTLGLTGTHVGCEHGVCGACTVRLGGASVRSCLLLAAQVDGHEVLTVEGLARDGRLTPLQTAFTESHALQCGFCTSGILMAASDLLKRQGTPSREEI